MPSGNGNLLQEASLEPIALVFGGVYIVSRPGSAIGSSIAKIKRLVLQGYDIVVNMKDLDRATKNRPCDTHLIEYVPGIERSGLSRWGRIIRKSEKGDARFNRTNTPAKVICAFRSP